MKNHSSSRAQKGKTSFRTPHTWITGRPEMLKTKNSNFKGSNKKFNSYPKNFTTNG